MDHHLQTMSRLAVMGGTFDPVHYGHLIAAEAARDQFALDNVIFVPAGRPPHKKNCRITSTAHRLNMSVLATASNPYFLVSRTEIDRAGYSYAVDTMTEFHRAYGEGVKWYFITGADAMMEIFTWKQVDRLMEFCDFIAATRPGYHLHPDNTIQKLPLEMRERIHLMEIPLVAISSTGIRQRVREGRPIKYLLPEPVEQYIIDNRLYLD